LADKLQWMTAKDRAVLSGSGQSGQVSADPENHRLTSDYGTV
jgi:hypothetical protein